MAKYADHQPLYRQGEIFGRAGLAIPRSTLAQWGGTCGVRLQPLMAVLERQMLKHRLLADKTVVRMSTPTGKRDGTTDLTYRWVRVPVAFEITRVVVCDFRDPEQANKSLPMFAPCNQGSERLPVCRAFTTGFARPAQAPNVTRLGGMQGRGFAGGCGLGSR